MPVFDPFGIVDLENRRRAEAWRNHAAGQAQQGVRDWLDTGNNVLNQGYLQGQDAINEGYGSGRGELQSWGERGLDLAGRGFDYAGANLGGGRRDATGAIQAGLAGGLGQIGAGAGAAQGLLAGQIGQDMAARGAYGDRLMGGLAGGDDPYWNRLSAQRQDSTEAALAKQGLGGSSAGAAAIAGGNAQLQDAREQQFFERAQGLFNAGAAQQAAGLAQGAGLAGAGLYGDMAGRAADAYRAFGIAGAQNEAERGRTLGGMATGIGQGLAGSYFGGADQLAGLAQNWSGNRAANARAGAQLYQGIWTGQASQPEKIPTQGVGLGINIGA